MFGILSYFSSSSQPATETILINGKRNFVLESYAKIVQSPLFERAEPEHLDHIKRVFAHYRLPFSHPVHKKVNDAIAKSPLAALRKADTTRLERLRDKMLTHKHSSSPTVFVQNCQTTSDVKKAIAKDGAQWQELVLNDVDDDMMALIAKTCTQLTTLRIIERTNSEDSKFTDSGLMNIANIPKLDTLELSIWTSIGISGVGLQQLLSQPKMQTNITDLTVVTYLMGDAILSVLGQYNSLQSLTVQTTGFTAQGVTAFLQTAPIRHSLQSLNIAMNTCWGSIFSPEVLTALAGLSWLTNLTLNGGWTITDQNMLTFLKAKPVLNTLGISGYTISQPVIEQVATMSSLQSLTLGDCSKVTQFTDLVKGQTNLNALSLGNVTYLSDIDLGNISNYPQLTSLALLNATNLCCEFDGFCNSPMMRNNLQSLYLSGNSNIPSKSMGLLRNLDNLTTLRMENMSYFNDDTLHMLTDHSSTLKNKMSTLELSGVSISDSSMSKFSDFGKLTTLMLVNTYAVTKGGMETFLQDSWLQKQLLQLYLNGQEVDHSLIKEFNDFSHLESLYLGNMVNLNADPDSKDLKTLWGLSHLKKNNTEIVAFWGELTSFAQFLQGL